MSGKLGIIPVNCPLNHGGRVMMIKLPQELTAIGDIERDFPNHWILIDRPQTDAAGKVTAGYLVMASQDPTILYQEAAKLKLVDCAFRCTKKTPPDLRFLL
jgi:hypothetical protein